MKQEGRRQEPTIHNPQPETVKVLLIEDSPTYAGAIWSGLSGSRTGWRVWLRVELA